MLPTSQLVPLANIVPSPQSAGLRNTSAPSPQHPLPPQMFSAQGQAQLPAQLLQSQLGMMGNQPEGPAQLLQSKLNMLGNHAEGDDDWKQMLHEVLLEVRNITMRAKSVDDEAASTAATEKERNLERCVEQLRARCQEHERNEEVLDEKVQELTTRRDILEAHVKELENEAAGHQKQAQDQVQRLEAEKRALECDLEKLHPLASIKGSLENQVQTLNSLKCSLETQARQRERELQGRINDVQQVSQRLEEEKLSLRRELDHTLELLEDSRHAERSMHEQQKRSASRILELEKSDQELRTQVRSLNRKSTQPRISDDRELELMSRLNAALEQARHLEAERHTFQVEAENARCHIQRLMEASRGESHETHDMRGRVAALEEQLRQQVEKNRQLEQEKTSIQHDSQFRHQLESNQENRALQKSLNEHKKIIWELDYQIKQERTANSITPGDFLRLVKAYEPDNLAVENADLRKALTTAQCELSGCHGMLSQERVHGR